MQPTDPPVRGSSRLTIEINDVPYRVIPLPITNGFRGYRIRKLTDSTEYYVHETQYDTTCTCPDYVTRKREGGCKHCKALRVFNLVF
jgi:hypothetical protein